MISLGLLASALGGCDPDATTGMGDPFDLASAALELDSAIALFECGHSAFGWVALGHEDVMQSVAGVAATVHVYRADPATGACDLGDTSSAWYDQFFTARTMLSNTRGDGVYDRLLTEPSLGSEGERLSAIAAIYMGAALAHFGEFYCETALDGGLMEPDSVLALAETWITDRALAHLDVHGDFALPNGIATSARHTAMALRARVRWARGDLTGAAGDAATVPEGFAAWVTRDRGPTRRNKIYVGATAVVFSSMLGVNDWWGSATRQPNPATGQSWPDPIPFTGYRFLGILPDGRAVDDQGYPIRWAEEERDNQHGPVPLGNGAVPDARVAHRAAAISGPSLHEVPLRYTAEDDDIPFVSWREMWLIRAEHAGGQTAIDLVNELRALRSLPLISYIDGTTATPEQIRHMILEERRREFYAEAGRFWSTKIRNPDVLWFPRAEGRTPWQGYSLQGGVRLALPAEQYTAARGGLAARGTGCEPAEAPVFR